MEDEAPPLAAALMNALGKQRHAPPPDDPHSAGQRPSLLGTALTPPPYAVARTRRPASAATLHTGLEAHAPHAVLNFDDPALAVLDLGAAGLHVLSTHLAADAVRAQKQNAHRTMNRHVVPRGTDQAGQSAQPGRRPGMGPFRIVPPQRPPPPPPPLSAAPAPAQHEHAPPAPAHHEHAPPAPAQHEHGDVPAAPEPARVPAPAEDDPDDAMREIMRMLEEAGE